MDTHKIIARALTLLLLNFMPLAIKADDVHPPVAVQPTPNEEKRCVLLLSTKKQPCAVGEPIVLNMTVTNRSKEDVLFATSSVLLTFDIKLKLPNGKPAPVTLYGDQSKLVSRMTADVRFTILKPDQSATRSFWLNRHFDMSLEGTYKVSVSTGVGTGKDQKTVTTLTTDLNIPVKEYVPPDDQNKG